MSSPEPSVAFDPVADERTRLLLLGSLPGQVSLRERHYYAHPQNQFWRLMSVVIDKDLVALAYVDRLAALLGSGIGLWDVIARGTRVGSLDSAIRAAEVRDLKSMIATLPRLRAVAFNGATAMRHGLTQLGDPPPLPVIGLPSSSATHAVGIATKQTLWSSLRDYVG